MDKADKRARNNIIIQVKEADGKILTSGLEFQHIIGHDNFSEVFSAHPCKQWNEGRSVLSVFRPVIN